MNYYIIIPAHNEEQFLRQTLDTVVAQSLRPRQVIVVNDNSQDKTAAIIEEFAAIYPFIKRVDTASSSGEHMPGSKVIRAFYKGMEHLDDNYDFIVKLDADLILPVNYFERVAELFEANDACGMAGGLLYIQDGSNNWIYENIANKDHLRGPVKAYTKKCFHAIKGPRPSIGWDTVDVLLAKYKGYETQIDPSLKVKHLRPTGNSYNAKAKFLQGEAMYKMRYGLFITILSSAKMAWKKQDIKPLINNTRGYLLAKKQRKSPIVTEAEGRFIRAYRWKGMFGKVKQLIGL